MSVKHANIHLRGDDRRMPRLRYYNFRQPKPKVDPKCQQATPESLRIEIDQIFKEFLDNPDETEYIFPPDLNNLQRKYIHDKAQEMNIISKSHGKEPDRRLHIKKRNQQPENQSFVIKPCDASLNYLHEYFSSAKTAPYFMPPHHQIHRKEKVIGRLVNGILSVPTSLPMPQEIVHIRKSLPIYDRKNLIIEAIRKNQVVIVSSETGSGKTTQVPQYIMEDMHWANRPCKIICTQPRRISTVSAAERVAYERGDVLGASVGYHIRLEQKYGINTNLIYCTTGVFLRNLMLGCEALTNITHIIIDEVHERDKLSDFLLTCLKQTLPYFPDLKLILMSATMNTSKFLEYFGQGVVLSIPGRLFPIETVFLEQILCITKYMSPKMRTVMQNDTRKIIAEHVVENVACSNLLEANLELDEALEEYMNFSDNYNYKVHYEEATVQLGMYFMSEGLSVDYQHSKTGKTALMIAASLGDKEFISRLCSMGANMDLRCNEGKTAYVYARNQPDILQLLDYIRSKRINDSLNSNINEKEGEFLLQLYDKTTTDDCIDYDLIVSIISFVHNSGQDGSVLIFLPGYDDIMLCNDRIVRSDLPHRSYKIFFLHSSMNIRDQHEVFGHIYGRRKIILSTNIAETSLTIDDVVFVIDSGKAKEKCYDSYNKVSSLHTRWISQACAKQRTGRAGRTRPGTCFRLFSKQRFENMEEERVPEILRVSLEELCLHTKVIAPVDVDIHKFLTMAPDAPSANSIKVAIENLQFLGALDKRQELTPLGEYLAQLAIDPHLGKMLIYSVIFRCVEPILTLAAALSHKDPFQLPPQANLKSAAAELRKGLLEGVMSDHLMYLMVFKKWQDATYNKNVNRFCKEYFISNPTMNSILETRSQLLGQLRAAGFIHHSNSLEMYNQNAQSWPLVKAIIAISVYPNIAYPSTYNNLATRSEKKVNIQNGSACYNKYISSWLIYDEKIKHRNYLMIRGVTAITTITISMLCGIYWTNSTPNSILLDDWLEFEFPDNTPLVLRTATENLVKNVLANPSYHYNEHDVKTVQTIRSILDVEEMYAELTLPRNIGDKPRFFLPQVQHGERRARPGQNPLRDGFSNSVAAASRDTEHVEQGMSTPASSDADVAGSFKDLNLVDGFLPEASASRSVSSSPFHCLADGVASRSPTASPFQNQAGSLLNTITIENKFGDYKDEKIFVLIKPKQKRSIEIAQHTNKWVFAPQTEKKILHYHKKGRFVYLLFTVSQKKSFEGMAEFISFSKETHGKPTCKIFWIYKGELDFANVRHLTNPYNENRPIFEGVDGQVIQQVVAEELVRIYSEVKMVKDGPVHFSYTS